MTNLAELLTFSNFKDFSINYFGIRRVDVDQVYLSFKKISENLGIDVKSNCITDYDNNLDQYNKVVNFTLFQSWKFPMKKIIGAKLNINDLGLYLNFIDGNVISCDSTNLRSLTTSTVTNESYELTFCRAEVINGHLCCRNPMVNYFDGDSLLYLTSLFNFKTLMSHRVDDIYEFIYYCHFERKVLISDFKKYSNINQVSLSIDISSLSNSKEVKFTSLSVICRPDQLNLIDKDTLTDLVLVGYVSSSITNELNMFPKLKRLMINLSEVNGGIVLHRITDLSTYDIDSLVCCSHLFPSTESLTIHSKVTPTNYINLGGFIKLINLKCPSNYNLLLPNSLKKLTVEKLHINNTVTSNKSPQSIQTLINNENLEWIIIKSRTSTFSMKLK